MGKLKINGRETTEIKHNTEKDSAWLLRCADDCFLLLSWEVDHNQYGHWCINLCSVKDKKIVTKEFSPGHSAPVFAGEVAIKGVGSNDLWCSFGFDDLDIKDEEGNVVNKPREVRIYPKRND